MFVLAIAEHYCKLAPAPRERKTSIKVESIVYARQLLPEGGISLGSVGVAPGW